MNSQLELCNDLYYNLNPLKDYEGYIFINNNRYLPFQITDNSTNHFQTINTVSSGKKNPF